MINNVINFDFSNYNVGVLTSNDITLDNLHNLSIGELGNRGLDISKLSKVDL